MAFRSTLLIDDRVATKGLTWCGNNFISCHNIREWKFPYKNSSPCCYSVKTQSPSIWILDMIRSLALWLILGKKWTSGPQQYRLPINKNNNKGCIPERKPPFLLSNALLVFQEIRKRRSLVFYCTIFKAGNFTSFPLPFPSDGRKLIPWQVSPSVLTDHRFEECMCQLTCYQSKR